MNQRFLWALALVLALLGLIPTCVKWTSTVVGPPRGERAL